MSLLQHALRAGRIDGAVSLPPRSGLVIAGAAGPLGAAVLERALAAGHWSAVSALVTQPIEVALRGLHAVPVPPNPVLPPSFAAAPRVGFIVFDRDGPANGREAAFLRPEPAQLPRLAALLQAAGVQQLVIVLPHAPALLPQALKAGLATLDEQAVAALGFERLVVVRPARTVTTDAAVGTRLQRLGRSMLAQLHWMVPQREQPLRAPKVAEFVVELARLLPGAPAGTRVVPPELLWDWAQPEGGDRVLQAWLRHDAVPEPALPAQRW